MASGDADSPVAVGEAVIVAGIGCRRDSSEADVEKALKAALSQLQSPSPLTRIAIPVSKSGEAGIAAAAAARGVELILISQTDLEAAAPRTLTKSAHSLAAMNVPSVAEAAALAGAGSNARLLVPRVATERVTCALAASEGP
jgi:cobalt-precorrin 5A hydrolase